MHRVYCIRKKKNHCIIKHITHAHYIDRQKKSLQKLFLRSRHVLCEFIWTTAERCTRDMFFFVYARFESPILLYLDLTPYKEASLPGYQHCARIIFKRNIVLLLARRYHMRIKIIALHRDISCCIFFSLSLCRLKNHLFKLFIAAQWILRPIARRRLSRVRAHI